MSEEWMDVPELPDDAVVPDFEEGFADGQIAVIEQALASPRLKPELVLLARIAVELRLLRELIADSRDEDRPPWLQ